MNRYDRWTGLGWAVVGVVMAVGSPALLPFGTPRQPGPSFLPALCGVVIAVLGAAVAVSRRASPAEPTTTATAAERRAQPVAQNVRIILTLVVLVLYAGLLEHLGFLVATFLAMLVIFTVVARGSWRAGVVQAAIVAVACYWLFAHLLGIPFPRGWLSF